MMTNLPEDNPKNLAGFHFINPSEFVKAIEAIVRGDITTTKKKTTVYVCACPFHSEKTASFTFQLPSEYFHCFGCGVDGHGLVDLTLLIDSIVITA